MKILVYGAGNIGQLYAALLAGAGQDVSILARGKRLDTIRENGIQLESVVDRSRTIERVRAVDALDPADDYDLVVVALPTAAVAEVLPILATNQRTPSVMFLANNAAGPGKMCEALGRERVLLGFPGAAASDRDGWLRYLVLSSREQPTTIGELDGTRSARIETIAAALRAAGFPVAICPNMQAWLMTHAAEISPTANALYMAGLDVRQLARTRDTLILLLRAIREGYRVLSANGIPITPASHRIFQLLPEPLLLVLMRRTIESDTAVIKIGHAAAARKEMKALADELRAIGRRASVATPAADRLYRYIDPNAEPFPDGSAKIPIDWRGVWLALGILLVAGAALALVL